jgi:hypothetical protein
MHKEVRTARVAGMTVVALLLVAACKDDSSAEGPGEPGTQVASFRFRMQDDLAGLHEFVATTSDPAVIAQVRGQLQLPGSMRNLHINGVIEAAGTPGDTGWNHGWDWRYADDAWELAAISAEYCDGTPEQVQQNLSYWLDTVGQFCPWGSMVVAEIPNPGRAAGIIVKFTTGLGNDAFQEHVRAIQGVAQQRGLSLTYEREGGLGWHVFSLDEQVLTVHAARLAYAIATGVPDIEYAEPNLIFHLD